MVISKLKTDQRIIRFSIATLLFVIIVISNLYNPDNYSITECSFKQITGYSCPSCGLTRSFHAVTNLNLAQAFAFHIIGPFLLLGFVFLSLMFFIESFTGRTIQLSIKRSTIKITLFVVGILWFIFWIVRIILEMR